jgi:thioredoxin-related protein
LNATEFTFLFAGMFSFENKQKANKMKKSILSLLAWGLPFLLMAQRSDAVYPDSEKAQPDNNYKGIKWVTGLTWEQVKQKAKQENKYIFIDAYATWCGPCKMMDKFVYPNDTVGDFFNEHFIAIKAQMDQTEKDDKSIIDWYKDASRIKSDYTVDSYPSLIFLSPDAKILQKEEGYRPVQKMIAVAKEALTPDRTYADPYKEYKALVKEYKQGIRRYDKMPYMIKTAVKLKDGDLAKELFKEHLDYTSVLNENERYTRENIEAWSAIILKIDSKALQLFLSDGEKIDVVMNRKGFASDVVDRTIQSRIVDSFFRMQKGETIAINGNRYSNSEFMFLQLPQRVDGKIKPDYVEADWKGLKRMISKKFNKDYVTRNVLKARMFWYLKHHNMEAASRMYFTELDKYPPSNLSTERITLNEFAWQTFLYVNNKQLLKKAAEWMEKLLPLVEVKSDGNLDAFLDTYASLLYKLGRTREALEWEEKALSATNPRNEPKKLIVKNMIEKMKKGEPTYLEQGAIWGRK